MLKTIDIFCYYPNSLGFILIDIILSVYETKQILFPLKLNILLFRKKITKIDQKIFWYTVQTDIPWWISEMDIQLRICFFTIFLYNYVFIIYLC